MIFNLFRRFPRDDSMAALYGAIVAQAREPEFYRAYGVPDTVNGRLEMIILHAGLVVIRMEAGGDGLRRLGQGLFDRFCSDMDANLREMGVGDLAVPRKMKAIGEAFYGRKRAYEAALKGPGLEPLIAALNRNVYDDGAGSGTATANRGAEPLARYVREVALRLTHVDESALSEGSIRFPDPAAFAAPQPAGTGAA
jgi:cytochrome b pre-mRNA-processing protein 3